MGNLKLAAGIFVLSLWGGMLLYLYTNPAEAAGWATYVGSRKIFVLDIHLQPTFITLGMGLTFLGLSLFGLYRLVSGKGPMA